MFVSTNEPLVQPQPPRTLGAEVLGIIRYRAVPQRLEGPDCGCCHTGACRRPLEYYVLAVQVNKYKTQPCEKGLVMAQENCGLLSKERGSGREDSHIRKGRKCPRKAFLSEPVYHYSSSPC
jgi:hypothetical protein